MANFLDETGLSVVWGKITAKFSEVNDSITAINTKLTNHNLPITNITAKTSYASTATTASANGGTIKVTDIKYDDQGHITGSQDRTITLSQTTYSLSGLGGIGSITCRPTAPLNLTYTKNGTTATLTGSINTAGAGTLGVVRGFHRTSGTATGTKTTSATNAPAVNSRTTTSGRYYGVETDASGYMFVNVPWVNSTYTVNNATVTIAAGTGLSTGGSFTTNQSSAATITLNHSNSITAGSVGSAQTPSHGGTFAIPKITYDAQGHITGATTVNITLPADNNTDTKVTQTVTSTNASYPLLLAPSGQTATTTTTSYFDSGVTLNPSTNTIAANISGNAATATKDGSGNTITSTYLKLSGGTMTGSVSFKSAVFRNSASWPAWHFERYDTINSTSTITAKSMDFVSGSSQSLPYRGFRVFSTNTTTSGAYVPLSYYEDYRLPSVNANKTSNSTYYILTTKSTVTIAQGGTGATTASAARTNLGIIVSATTPSSPVEGMIWLKLSS